MMKTHAQWVVTLGLLLLADVAARVGPGALAGAPKQRDTLAGHTEFVASVAFSPDGKTLAASVFAHVALWEVPGGKRTATLLGHEKRVLCVAFSPDGKTLASGSEDMTVRLWNVAASEPSAVLKAHNG